MNVEKSAVSADTRALMKYQARSKSTGIAYLLWFFLGGFGVHRFYLGSVGVGVAVLICTILGFVLLFPLIITGLVLLYDMFTLPSRVAAFNERLMAEIGV